MKNKKHKLFLACAITLLTLALSGYLIYANNQSGGCNSRSLGPDGKCLPRGQCYAPNDAPIDCDRLNKDGSYKY